MDRLDEILEKLRNPEQPTWLCLSCHSRKTEMFDVCNCINNHVGVCVLCATRLTVPTIEKLIDKDNWKKH